MAHLNDALWTLSLALQVLLLVLLLTRGLARLLPVFTGLVAFYIGRSVVLFAVFHHISPAAYGFTYNLLSLADLGLQAAVAWELVSVVRPATGTGPAVHGMFGRLARFSALLLVSAAIAWALSEFIPKTPRSPVDRGVVMAAALMLGVAAASKWKDIPAAAARVLQGFVVLGIVGILAQVERTLAAFHRDAPAFQRWSYAETAAYFAVLLFWLIALPRRERFTPSFGSRTLALD